MISGQSIVVTGVSSFIGMHLAAGLAERGGRVIGTVSRPLERYDSREAIRLQRLLDQGIQLERLDITDALQLEAFITRYQPQLWFHHAGWAKDYGSPAYDLSMGHRINVMPLESLYPLLKQNGCQGIITTGSSAEYSDSMDGCNENDACLPTTPYGLSKLTGTLRAYQLATHHALPTRVARVFIPYGSLDSPQKLITSVVQALKQGQPVDLSPCLQKRDFLPVWSLVEGYTALAEDLGRAEMFDIFNLCSGEAVTLKAFLETISQMLGADPSLLRFGVRGMRPGEPPVSYGDANKAKILLHWQANSLHESLVRYLQEEVHAEKPIGTV